MFKALASTALLFACTNAETVITSSTREHILSAHPNRLRHEADTESRSESESKSESESSEWYKLSIEHPPRDVRYSKEFIDESFDLENYELKAAYENDDHQTRLDYENEDLNTSWSFITEGGRDTQLVGAIEAVNEPLNDGTKRIKVTGTHYSLKAFTGQKIAEVAEKIR